MKQTTYSKFFAAVLGLAIGAAQAGAVGERTGKFWMLKFRVHIYAPPIP